MGPMSGLDRQYSDKAWADGVHCIVRPRQSGFSYVDCAKSLLYSKLFCVSWFLDNVFSDRLLCLEADQDCIVTTSLSGLSKSSVLEGMSKLFSTAYEICQPT